MRNELKSWQQHSIVQGALFGAFMIFLGVTLMIGTRGGQIPMGVNSNIQSHAAAEQLVSNGFHLIIVMGTVVFSVFIVLLLKFKSMIDFNVVLNGNSSD